MRALVDMTGSYVDRVWGSTFWAFLFFFGALASPLCNAFLSLRIPLSHPGSVTIFATVATAAAVAAFIFVRVLRRIQALMCCITVLVFVDMAYEGRWTAQLWGASFQWAGIPPDPGRVMVIAAAAIAAYAISISVGKELGPDTGRNLRCDITKHLVPA